MSSVYFIGAGPGDPELITVKGKRLIEQADLVLYAGSLVPRELVACARDDAEVADSAPLSLSETHELMLRAVRSGGIVARVHTGDPGLYGAVREQAELLDRDGVRWEIVPGVTSASAAVAAAGRSFTVPGGTQTLILSRLAGRTPVPESEHLRELARHGSSMAVYLSAGDPEGVRNALLEGGMASSTFALVAYRVGWPEEKIVETTVSGLAETARDNGFTRQTLFMVLPGQDAESARSLLYDEDFRHMFRG
ncbi:precorrin-4 C(11)-methyltransferase [Desulfovibrio oxyclinae]|uniref:precorrin-4 C(11)-methyltransferase n=1 Tax=Desulfovibrio oxyclinae TaxID=63560 RepID=UPI00037A4559|nr:precorrin-4 C(11)-methyltransferase [Desulfovibrio oxyclinae]